MMNFRLLNNYLQLRNKNTFTYIHLYHYFQEKFAFDFGDIINVCFLPHTKQNICKIEGFFFEIITQSQKLKTETLTQIISKMKL